MPYLYLVHPTCPSNQKYQRKNHFIFSFYPRKILYFPSVSFVCSDSMLQTIFCVCGELEQFSWLAQKHTMDYMGSTKLESYLASFHFRPALNKYVFNLNTMLNGKTKKKWDEKKKWRNVAREAFQDERYCVRGRQTSGISNKWNETDEQTVSALASKIYSLGIFHFAFFFSSHPCRMSLPLSFWLWKGAVPSKLVWHDARV